MKNRWKTFTIQKKLTLTFILTTTIILVVNFYLYNNINSLVNNIDAIYMSNVKLNELSETLTSVQESMTDYLNTKTSDAMEEYYRNEQDYNNQIQELNDRTTGNELLLMEKNIRNMSEEYLKMTDQTIEAKRGRNVEKYRINYDSATQMYEYIRTYVDSLNNEQFVENSNTYKEFFLSVYYVERVSIVFLIAIAVCNLLLISFLTRNITSPLRVLAATANQVAGGNLDVELISIQNQDEIGVVSKAFNKMLISIREYIVKLTDSMEKERKMKEKELLMETHLKDAQLRYLQAQINPHFLFNTLNAGAQLAMMEGADCTYEYVQNMADFFRYNVQKNNKTVTIREEINLVDNYIYILNVRFSGEIHFKKNIDESLLRYPIPCMILQPIVENSVNYGIRDIPWEGVIELSVFSRDDSVCISIRDNGIGMSEEKIAKIMSSQLKTSDISDDSNGIGLDNVIGRLKLFYGTDDVISIISDGEDRGTETIIYIPAEERVYDDV